MRITSGGKQSLLALLGVFALTAVVSAAPSSVSKSNAGERVTRSAAVQDTLLVHGHHGHYKPHYKPHYYPKPHYKPHYYPKYHYKPHYYPKPHYKPHYYPRHWG